MTDDSTATPTALVVGASRTLGLALTREFLDRGWRVVATVRSGEPDELRELGASSDGRLSVEHLDMTDADQVEALRGRLRAGTIDVLFVNAGATNENVPVEEVPTDDFVHVMVTNALSPMRLIAALDDVVTADGAIAVMSSRQGSISMNEGGGHEVYRASKSALNQLMRSYAARNADSGRTLLLMHPGWVQTELGGPGAPLTVDESAHGVADVVDAHRGDGGLQFLDYEGNAVAW